MESVAETIRNLNKVTAAKPQRTLVAKLAEVMAAVKRIPKSGYNSFHDYHYATEADLADAMRDELAKRKVFIFPTVIDIKRTPLDVESQKGVRHTQLTEIIVHWSFEDGESGEVRQITIPGVGEDNVDKGFYKAFTGSEKYMLMKAFLVPTYDDPERESGTDRYDAREKQQQVASRKIRAKAGVTAEGETLAVGMWGKGYLSLSGNGISILRAEMPAEEATRMGIKLDKASPNVVYIPAKNSSQLVAFCALTKIPMHWSKEAIAEREASAQAQEEPGANG